MIVDINGGALDLLLDFIRYSTQAGTRAELADAMYYDYDTFFSRAAALDRQLQGDSDE